MNGTIELWTDGSCLNIGVDKPQPMGYGILVRWSTDEKPEGIDLLKVAVNGPAGTNNRAELGAILFGLTLLTDQVRKDNLVKVCSDSEYALGQAFGLYKIRKNVDLVKALQEKVIGFTAIESCHIKGHSGVEHNETVDNLANMGRTAIGTTFWEPPYSVHTDGHKASYEILVPGTPFLDLRNVVWSKTLG